ncbi:NADPH-dependent FMN reductase [Glycomyces algeriensis]|uniref:FMN reductase n=1 Tax=Glycomyces algeriensis TaxID=256037 RepID=A0A9W6LHB8_9ACTN|nr:NAD(P)H-dependent oxidoreductase [Glycomyces algeriensis]MDA1364717.1 NAD(P)H-dependent oxidoreductase [Glycomyces algeriensis]MDR7350757.1 FMN reductase [Glycomyces algeriensis]GLI43468.1 FMN reductase [Glycomyces algeriensis]
MTAAISLTTVVGNPKRLSRTLTTAEALAAAIGSELRAEPRAASIDLAELYLDGIEPPHDGFEHAATQVHTANVLIVGTPVYKASYTGLLKLFLDQLAPRALEGVLAVPVTIAASAEHRFLADLQLRPVLAELGASLPVPSLALRESELPALPEHIGAWTEAHAPALEAALGLGRKPVGAAA